MRVLVAMSGGVDSSVAAALLVDEGHDVTGCTLRLWGEESDRGCCSAADVDDARRVAQVLGIDHHVFELSERFGRDVVDPYVAAHAEGRTPNPCVECNRAIKFGALLDRATRLGFDALATGHHARVVAGADGPELRRGVDRDKDQSYVLGVLRREELERVVLPVGDHRKEEVRRIAAARGLRTWDKPDSQDVCFVPGSDRGAFLRTRIELSRGLVFDQSDGEDRGELADAQLVTVGQRRGIPRGADGSPRYVVDVDLDEQVVRIASLRDALQATIALDPETLRTTGGALRDGDRVVVQAAAHGRPLPGTLVGGARLRIELDEPARPIAPGQLAVLYDAHDPDLVVGSATVAGPTRALAPS